MCHSPSTLVFWLFETISRSFNTTHSDTFKSSIFFSRWKCKSSEWQMKNRRQTESTSSSSWPNCNKILRFAVYVSCRTTNDVRIIKDSFHNSFAIEECSVFSHCFTSIRSIGLFCGWHWVAQCSTNWHQIKEKFHRVKCRVYDVTAKRMSQQFFVGHTKDNRSIKYISEAMRCVMLYMCVHKIKRHKIYTRLAMLTAKGYFSA